MTYEKTYEIQNNNQLIINLPNSFKSSKRVKVTVKEIDLDRSEKIEMVKEASSDPLFLSNVAEINEDFEHFGGK